VGLLALAAVAGLAAVERKGFLQAMLSRPVVLGPLCGLACGDAGIGLLVGAPLELLWLGAVNLGAAVPLNEALGTAAIAGGAAQAARHRGGATSAVAVAVALGLPFSLLGRRADALVERVNDRLLERAAARLRAGDEPGVLHANLLGLVGPFALSALIAPAAAASIGVLAPAIVRSAPGLAVPLAGSFAAFTAFACAAGASALRARRAPAAWLGATAAGLVLLGWWGRLGR
jgi:mannose/fructose/N-acetylgalactosamine-specific phosphotransferase system component IIC